MKRRTFLLCLPALCTLSCEKSYLSSIPDYPVYLALDLTFEDKGLLPVSAYKIYTPANINQATEKTGFGGVLVYHGIDSYYAFDTACPHEANRSVTVEVDDNHLYATCPKCHTQYDLLSGMGNPVSGPGREQLKPYRVRQNGNILYVENQAR
jgi:nitrite reductase/ring-hydroxylating ferredoxin subunit